MSALKEKFEELVARVGNSESNYCGGCRKTTEHRITYEKEDGNSGPPTHHFFLKCKVCGMREALFTY